MRREKDLLSDSVDVHTHAQRAAARTNGSGRLQAVLDAPQPSDTLTLWERIKRYFPQPEVLEVAGRAVAGFVIPHWAAGVLLAAILGSMGVMYSKISDQRDMLIRLDTQLQERDKHELEYRSEFKSQLNVQKVYIDNMTNQLNTIKGLMSANSKPIERKDN